MRSGRTLVLALIFLTAVFLLLKVLFALVSSFGGF